MKKNLKICISVTIDTSTDVISPLPCNVDGALGSVKTLIRETDLFYEKTETYLRSLLCPAKYDLIRQKIENKDPATTEEFSTLMLSYFSSSDQTTAIAFKGVTKEISDAV